MPIATPARPSTRPPDLQRDYEPGDLIAGKYRLEGLLGEGGMGSVWFARNTTLHLDVALKLIRSDIATEEASQRLLQEARAAAKLGHPNIVRVHDFGETERHEPFIVMEVLDGDSLEHRLLYDEVIEPTYLVQILLPIFSALALAHSKGVVHRDIKPDNILLIGDDDDDLVPKLVDFGIAKLKYRSIEVEGGRESLVAAIEVAEKITQFGHIVGSPQYMAPEQAAARSDVDGRADLWSMSVVMYQALTGRLPFDHEDCEELFKQIFRDAPEPITDDGIGDETLWKIIEKGLHKQRDKRWQSAKKMGAALALWLVERGIDTDITGKSLRKQWLGIKTSSGLPMPEVVAQPREEAPSSIPAPLTTRDTTAVRIRALVLGSAGLLLLGTAIAIVAVMSGSTGEQASTVAAPQPSVTATAELQAPPSALRDQREVSPEPAAATTAAPTESASPAPKRAAKSASAKQKPKRPTRKAARKPAKKPAKKPVSGDMPLPDGANF